MLNVKLVVHHVTSRLYKVNRNSINVRNIAGRSTALSIAEGELKQTGHARINVTLWRVRVNTVNVEEQ